MLIQRLLPDCAINWMLTVTPLLDTQYALTHWCGFYTGAAWFSVITLVTSGVESYRFLGTFISQDLKTSKKPSRGCTDEIPPAKDDDGALLHCRCRVHPHLLHHHVAPTARDKSKLQRIVRSAKMWLAANFHTSRAESRTIRVELLALLDIFVFIFLLCISSISSIVCCFAPTDSKFLVCVILLGDKSNSDVDVSIAAIWTAMDFCTDSHVPRRMSAVSWQGLLGCSCCWAILDTDTSFSAETQHP